MIDKCVYIDQWHQKVLTKIAFFGDEKLDWNIGRYVRKKNMNVPMKPEWYGIRTCEYCEIRENWMEYLRKESDRDNSMVNHFRKNVKIIGEEQLNEWNQSIATFEPKSVDPSQVERKKRAVATSADGKFIV